MISQSVAEIVKRHVRLTVDGIDRMRAQQGGFRAGRSLRVYGPRTRREFLALLAQGARPGG